ncbi:protein translation factor SUI1 homolog [Solanum dulcamara]|uniref:protein translation factor SUI1 homolog n=1 Tax=Solanum dulcamara TaxID=45834 RepID=UPI002485224A|nr:protein translation factor SUI1 homolog [Solanum dulcamara]
MVDTNFQVPTSFDPFAESNDSDSPGTKGSRALGAKYRGSHSGLLGFNDVQIPMTFDPFTEAKNVGAFGTKEYVHIRIQQRNNRKSLTTIQGLKKEFSYEKLLKDLKKEFCCNGNVVQDKELGKVIQLQGDQRKNVSQFLVNADIVKKEQIKIHGF